MPLATAGRRRQIQEARSRLPTGIARALRTAALAASHLWQGLSRRVAAWRGQAPGLTCRAAGPEGWRWPERLLARVLAALSSDLPSR